MSVHLQDFIFSCLVRVFSDAMLVQRSHSSAVIIRHTVEKSHLVIYMILRRVNEEGFTELCHGHIQNDLTKTQTMTICRSEC